MPQLPQWIVLTACLALAACSPAGTPTQHLPEVAAASAGGDARASAEAAEPRTEVLYLEVTTTRARAGSIDRQIFASGSLVALRESPIGAEVRGRIQQVFVREADRVEAGDSLFQIDPEPYQVALRQAEAGLDLARAERGQIEADLARLSALHRKSIVAVDELQRSKTAVAVASARERQAEEGVALARHNLSQTLVRAPFGGSIADRRADEGTTAQVQPQTIVVVLQETMELEARANIPESEVLQVRRGDVARVYVDDLADPIETRVASVGDSIDPATRTYRVTMRIPNVDHRLKGGTFARIEIQPQPRQDAIVVPRDSIRSEGGRSRVLVVEDSRVVAVPVDLGAMSDSEAEILRGIAPGAEVLTGDAARDIAPGMRVRIINRPQAP